MKKMAYKSKGMKAPKPDMSAPSMGQSDAPKHKPSMKASSPSGPFSSPMGGEQSAAPDHKKKAMTMEKAPKGVSGVNGGSSMSMPKGGGVGESEV